MLPKICIACGEPITGQPAANPNVCIACCSLEDKPMEAEQPLSVEPRLRNPGEIHAPRRRSLVVGDHSHARKTPPTLPRRKH